VSETSELKETAGGKKEVVEYQNVKGIQGTSVFLDFT
jgi:hypothetical protein